MTPPIIINGATASSGGGGGGGGVTLQDKETLLIHPRQWIIETSGVSTDSWSLTSGLKSDVAVVYPDTLSSTIQVSQLRATFSLPAVASGWASADCLTMRGYYTGTATTGFASFLKIIGRNGSGASATVLELGTEDTTTYASRAFDFSADCDSIPSADAIGEYHIDPSTGSAPKLTADTRYDYYDVILQIAASYTSSTLHTHGIAGLYGKFS